LFVVGKKGKVFGGGKRFFPVWGKKKPPLFPFPPPKHTKKKKNTPPGESGFTVTVRLTIQPSGSAFLHESSGTVAPIIDVSGRQDNFR
ncbi:hypothetical protein, partial [Escherichia coli]|uniref:hypothetical protein n=1 Tax=Escherichia coli TaxID=562 RepID=UPI003D336749